MSEDKKPEKPEKPGFMTLGWFAPLYRRVILVAAIACWTLWEWFYNHDQFWGVLSLVMLAYGIWTFFITFDKTLEEVRKNAKPKS
ncbi:hypothetical protein GCM10011321_37210 [Youhaiella tibetensis]|uniref:DUF3329 domain-containing protein n=1 Tax=Paradevosia tibetensis TaxID=1447062 RepID=A0A5B9DT35_9HYPH|nr:DUF3329 domain-containing protein [Youhaiella tibetensis]QEE22333.1 DUF3329 domain-containing protein [Youhaiella tibetensis]GGF43191.1 hypothetical protein GCM10011321_37210 [Youhaiella tibetensis]